MDHPWQPNIIEEARRAADQARIFPALQRFSDRLLGNFGRC
jgi:hypothetical protein